MCGLRTLVRVLRLTRFRRRVLFSRRGRRRCGGASRARVCGPRTRRNRRRWARARVAVGRGARDPAAGERDGSACADGLLSGCRRAAGAGLSEPLRLPVLIKRAVGRGDGVDGFPAGDARMAGPAVVERDRRVWATPVAGRCAVTAARRPNTATPTTPPCHSQVGRARRAIGRDSCR